MGRPDPCVLFSQTFVHPQLDEYVDEVLFSEPVVITACEFLEQNGASSSQVVPLVGATSPASFALELFVQCEGETRFRRLCQPFLYSHSSSNVLEVEAIVTNHMVVRGCYRSLSLIIYGNTAEDLGQFNIEFNDSSLTDFGITAEGKLEDLPLALKFTNRTLEESLAPLKVLHFPVSPSDISVEVRQFLQLILKVWSLPNFQDSLHKVVGGVVGAVCSYVTPELSYEARNEKQLKEGQSKGFDELHRILNESRNELLKVLQHGSGDESVDYLADCTFLESDSSLATSKQLVDMLSQYFWFDRNSGEHYQLLQNKNIILGLCVALLLCSSSGSCFHFVTGGGMEQLLHVFQHDMQNSPAIMLLVLGVIEQATRHPVGCEGVLGWWPREVENIPAGISKGYSQLLELLLQKPRHDIASLATIILHRLRFYEVASRYECAVLYVLSGQPSSGTVASDMLSKVKSELKKLLKLINSHGPVEDHSPAALASKSLILGQIDGVLSYKSTSNLIGSSDCSFSRWDIDVHLLGILKERCFLPLSAALLSSPALWSETGDDMETLVDIAATIGSILVSLLLCRSGLLFLLHHPELSSTLIDALRGSSDMNNEECVPLRYASVLLSKGFVCSPQEVGTVIDTHLRVVNAIDHLLVSTPQSEEFLWVLWELCGLSRTDCGRQALFVLGYFPEAISMLIEALHSAKESESIAKTNGASPINAAIFHSAAEVFEVLVTDSTALSLDSWIGHAIELQKALHSSSPGSNRKDAPTRLLEWIDAAVFYHKNGVIGLLRYSAVLVSGADANFTSTSTLLSDLVDLENVMGDTSGGSEINVIENLGKLVSEKTFDGITLRDSSIAQLTTAIRILAFLSENSTVAAALYDEGAITVIYSVLVNCSFMLERSSNVYDYLVDDGTELNATSDLLLERNREQFLVDLLVPSLLLVLNLLKKLQEANEQHRNTKLVNALLRLHREVSPKLAACAADFSSSYPYSALGFGAVCHLIVSALTCWPVFGWTPGLFPSLLANVQATSVLALGPKETCSLLCILNDLFPEEGVWLWENGMPPLSALRSLAIGTLLGSHKERQANWYLQPSHIGKLLGQLTPHLDKIAQIVRHYAISSLLVVHDMIRLLIVRIARQKDEKASVLLRPILSCIHDHVSSLSSPSDIECYKVYQYLDFLASIMEHQSGKALLLEEGYGHMLVRVLERCSSFIESDERHISEIQSSIKPGITLISLCLPVFKSIRLLWGSPVSLVDPAIHDGSGVFRPEDCSLILLHLLKFCRVLPVGKELLACIATLKEFAASDEGRSGFLHTLRHVSCAFEDPESKTIPAKNEKYSVDQSGWRDRPPFLLCWIKLLDSIDSEDVLSPFPIEAVNLLSIDAIWFCLDAKSLNLKAVDTIKCLFGLRDGIDEREDAPKNIRFIQEMTVLLSSKITDLDYLASSELQASWNQAEESAKSLLLLLQNPTGSVTLEDVCAQGVPMPSNDVPVSSKISQISGISSEMTEGYIYTGMLGEKFLWECPEPLPDRMPQALHGKRKLASSDGSSKRVKEDNPVVEITGQNAFSRGSGPAAASSGPTRRDTFRQRKPNTSRPPSMHVDDYVARERSVDANSNVISVPRVGSSGGRPPSIHVDEFMARQRERQNPMSTTLVGEPSGQVKNAAPASDAGKERVSKTKQLKTDMDDDLQGIDIVFDGEESETDDKLPFLQPDDNLQQPAPVIMGQSSPRSIVEETESDVNETSQFPRFSTPVASHGDENTQSEFSSRMSVSQPGKSLTREPSVSSDKKFFEQSDDSKNVPAVKASAGYDLVTGVPTLGNTPASYARLPMDSKMNQQNLYMRNSPHVAGSRGFYDQKVPRSQPPLPPMPPPPKTLPVMSQTSEATPGHSSPFITTSMDSLSQLAPPFQVQSNYHSPFGNGSASSLPMPDSKYPLSSISSPGGSTGPHPPLPPTPPPYTSSPYNLPSLRAPSQSSGYSVGTSDLPPISGGGLTSYMPPSTVAPLIFSRPAITPYGSTSNQQQAENLSVMQNMPVSQPSIQSLHQLQPLQPPLQRPPQPPQTSWSHVQSSQHLEQGISLQSPIQMQVHQMQMLQPPQAPPVSMQYQAKPQELPRSWQHQQVDHVQPQALHLPGDTSQKQEDYVTSLHEYFKDPKAITSLLSNKEELCRLLEQHPKLMQMLQEKLGQQ